MAILPSSADVDPVALTRDPGLRVPSIQVPAGAFKSPIGVVAEEILPGIERLEVVARKQQSREDAVESSRRVNQHNRDLDNELRRLNVESDLSKTEVLEEYGQFIAVKKQELLGSFTGSGDSLARLTVRLQDIGAAATGRAAGLSATIGRQHLQDEYDDALSPLGASAGQDPSRRNIDQQFLNLKTIVDDLRIGLDPGEEETLIREGREHISLSALDNLLGIGRVERAEVLLGDPGILSSLSPEIQRVVRKRIGTIRSSKNDLMNEISQIEQTLGRKMTQTEILKLVKISPTIQKATERDKKLTRLVERGLSEEFSEDLVDGRIKVIGPDNEGNIFTVNTVTNEKTLVQEEDRKIILDQIQPEERPEEQPEEQPEITEPSSLELAVEKGTGPFAKIQAGISNVFGPFLTGKGDVFFEDTTDARQQIRIFSQIAKAALVNNPKFPITEQKIVQTLLPDADVFFQDPDTARSNLIQLKSSLRDMQTAKSKELSKRITTKRRGDLIDQISRIGEILSVMEVPVKPEDDEFGFVLGKIYEDESGNKARYLGDNKWESL